jgi:hypothetical protein
MLAIGVLLLRRPLFSFFCDIFLPCIFFFFFVFSSLLARCYTSTPEREVGC